jgi:hypothetical protein
VAERETPTTRAREIPLSERVALRIDEAAASVGLSERSFRDHFLADPACPRIYSGKRVLIPRRLFEQYVEKRVEAEPEPDSV